MPPHNEFEGFLAAYPPEGAQPRKVNVAALARSIQDRFRVAPPPELVSFWQEVGSGYFGNRELFFFGDAPPPGQERDIVSWNGMGVTGRPLLCNTLKTKDLQLFA